MNRLWITICLLAAVSVAVAKPRHRKREIEEDRDEKKGAYDEDTRKAAAECCPSEARECCMEAIEFNRPIICAGIHASKNEETQMCIQNSIHGNFSSTFLSILHKECCDVFEDHPDDPEGTCQTKCRLTLSIPSHPASHKRRMIEGCRRNNDMMDCFDECRVSKLAFLKGMLTNDPSSRFNPHNLCSFRKKKVGILYPVSVDEE